MDPLPYALAVRDHSNLISILDGGEAVSYPGAGAASLALSNASWTSCTMNKPKGELKPSTGAVPTRGAPSLSSVIEQ